MKKTPMPPRSEPLPRGKPLARTSPSPSHAKPSQPRRRRRETGFSAEVKLAVRTRAGQGNAEYARCEACGIYLGLQGGQVHHRRNRQMGGSRFRNGISNAALLCGTPDDLDTCHGKATALTGRMIAMGYVLTSGDKPEDVPVMLHGTQGGVLCLLTTAGTYQPYSEATS